MTTLAPTSIEQLHKRHLAAQRLEPLSSGLRDPLDANLNRTQKRPATTIAVLQIGGLITREEAIEAWNTYPEQRDFIEKASAAQSIGWERNR